MTTAWAAEVTAGPRRHRAVWTGATRASALACVLALALTGCRPAAPAPAPPREAAPPPLEPVRAVYVEPTPALLPYWAAVDGGFFARNGLNVQLLPVASATDALTLLQTGLAEVFLAPLSPALFAHTAPSADLVLLGGTPDLAMVTRRPLVASREFILERFLRGVLEGIHTVRTRPDTVRELLARQGVGGADGAGTAYAERVPYLTASDIEPILAAGPPADPVAAPLTPDRLLDQTLLRRLEASGFVAALYRA